MSIFNKRGAFFTRMSAWLPGFISGQRGIEELSVPVERGEVYHSPYRPTLRLRIGDPYRFGNRRRPEWVQKRLIAAAALRRERRARIRASRDLFSREFNPAWK